MEIKIVFYLYFSWNVHKQSWLINYPVKKKADLEILRSQKNQKHLIVVVNASTKFNKQNFEYKNYWGNIPG